MRQRADELESSSAHLLAKIAEGDVGAFQVFYGRYAPGLLAYLRQICQDSGLAEDLTQEVFVTVWRKAASFQPDRGAPAGWLFSISRHKVIDHWRRTGGSAEPGEVDLEEMPVQARPHELRLSVRQALSQVSPDQRRAIAMAYFGGLTYEETARRLRLPLGTLKSRIRIGLKAMRMVLEGG